MRTEEDVTEVVKNWRAAIKNKKRLIFSLNERAEIRLNTLKNQIYRQHYPVDTWQIRQCYFRDLGVYEYLDSDWRAIHVGDRWGGTDVTAFFRRQIEIPSDFGGQRVALRFYIGGDSLVSVDGVPFQGIDPFRDEVILAENARGGERLMINVEAYVNWHTGEADNKIFHQAELATVDREIYAAYWDFWAAYKVLAIEDLNEELRAYLERALWEALQGVPPTVDDPGAFKTAVLTAQEKLRQTVYASDRFKVAGLMHLVGHSHLDLVFMWPYREYVRKIGRTHATMLRLMEQYPEFKFCQSMANTYAEMKVHFPEIYAQVKQRVAEGRWEIIGACWVEPDCNLISGESFVRQILHGQKFFEQEFGLRSQTCWQPDVFGMSAAMPQILKRSGVKYVMTTKMFVWNDTNRWNKNTFWWEGLDGSRVFAVVPPSHFIGMVDPDHLHNHWRDFSDRETVGESLYCYGWGEGGGGVDIEMLESARRYQDFMGLTPLKFSGAEEALASIQAKAETVDLPVWRDELYLEAHRGTFTNKGILKKLNRRAELLYRQAELLATLAWGRGAVYPGTDLQRGWQELLTTQFHDSLPGTHIHEVVEDLLEAYARLDTLGQAIRDQALATLFQPDPATPRVAGPTCAIVFNAFLHPRNDFVLIPAPDLAGLSLAVDGQLVPRQTVTDLGGNVYCLAKVTEIPPVGYQVFELVASQSGGEAGLSAPVRAEGLTLENALIRATFDERGELISLWDKEGERQVIVHGKPGNHFQLFEDIPGKYDAWDIVATYADHEINMVGDCSIAVEENGPVRASLRLEKSFRQSHITQRISLYADSRQLAFETRVHWNERQKLLKVGFTVDVHADWATYDIAYGNLRRPNHRNTSYDAAKFEVPAHQWMDLSQKDYGVSLLNDSKYGHEANGQQMRLTLLKGSVYPDEYADVGDHDFTYALYPHAGSWEDAPVIQQAANLNQPMLVKLDRRGVATSRHGFITCEAANITLEAVKRAEDRAAMIVRVVERHNRLTRTKLFFDRPVKQAWACDLMENVEGELKPEGSAVPVTLRPYEILTMRLVF